MTNVIFETPLAQLDIASLVPDQFADYRPPIVDGLHYFLQHLSAPRQAPILEDQIKLSPAASVEARLVSVARHCPILQKLGQVLARDRRLPADFRLLLQGLETAEPTMSGHEAREIVQAELGDLDELAVRIDQQPLAEASLAVVIPFLWQDGDHCRRGVFKLLKPNIQQHLAEELQLLTEVGNFLDERCEHYGIPEIDYEELFMQVRNLLNNEVDLRREQEHMEAARLVYADSPGVIIPKLFPFCSARVTAMERIDGRKVTELTDVSPTQRRRLASRLIEVLIATPIWSTNPAAVFHADPHAGNLLVTDDYRLAILDWGLVGMMTEQQRVDVSQIMIGALTLNRRRIVNAIGRLSNSRCDDPMLRRVVDQALRSIRRGTLPGLRWLTGLMDDAVARAGVTFPADLLLFRKVLLMMEGVVADVSEDCRPSIAMAASMAMRLATEWRERILSCPLTPASGSHLSNADLLTLLGSGPLTTAKFWGGHLGDLVQLVPKLKLGAPATGPFDGISSRVLAHRRDSNASTFGNRD